MEQKLSFYAGSIILGCAIGGMLDGSLGAQMRGDSFIGMTAPLGMVRDFSWTGTWATICGKILLLYAYAIFVVLLYKSWSLVQDATMSLAPRAVVLMFVPLLNLVWMFVAISCFPGRFNRFVDRHEIGAPKLARSPFLALPLLTLSQPIAQIMGVGPFICIVVCHLAVLYLVVERLVDINYRLAPVLLASSQERWLNP